MSILEQVEQLVDKARDELAKATIPVFYEPALESILDFIKSNPDDGPRFKAYFVDSILQDGPLPREAIEYCMFELRWPEVLAAVKKRIEDAGDPPEPGVLGAMRSILAAFCDDWDGAALYARYIRRCRGGRSSDWPCEGGNGDVIEILERLVDQAETDISNLHSTSFFEPALVQVLDFIKCHPDEWPRFKAYFITDILHVGPMPWELIEFCMVELRWPEVYAAAKKCSREAEDPRVHAVMAKILGAYDDHWDGAEMYEYYAHLHEGDSTE